MNNQPPSAQSAPPLTRVTEEQWAAMSARERLDYARQFDQTQYLPKGIRPLNEAEREHADETELPSPVPTIPADAFGHFLALINLIADPKGSAARLRSLQERQAAALAAQAALTSDQAAARVEMEKRRTELAKAEQEIRKRELKVLAAEGRLKQAQDVLAEQQGTLDRRAGRYKELSNGLVQEFSDRDSEHEEAEESPSVYSEEVPGSRLTRTVEVPPRPRKSMRRGAEV
jgi:hypothetical protein